MVSSEYYNCQRLPLCLYLLGVVRKKKNRENNSRKLMPNKNMSCKKKKKKKKKYKIWVQKWVQKMKIENEYKPNTNQTDS